MINKMTRHTARNECKITDFMSSTQTTLGHIHFNISNKQEHSIDPNRRDVTLGGVFRIIIGYKPRDVFLYCQQFEKFFE